MCTANSKLAGFTLLEMLIAIAIFAMLGIAANSVLSAVMKNDEVTQDFAIRLKALQQGFGALERDLGQMVARTPRSFEGDRGKQFFQAGDNILDSDTQALLFFRLGWLNPDGMLPRGSVQSVAYVVQSGRLERWYYPYPEPVVGAEPLKSLVIEGVLSIEYSFFIDDKWQTKADGTVMPKGIAMEIDIEGLGKIQRRFLLPKGAPVSDSKDSEDSEDSKDSEESEDSKDSEDEDAS